MASNKASNEAYIGRGGVSGLKTTNKTEEELQRALMGKFIPEEVADKYEEALGIPKKTVAPRKFQVRNQILNLNKEVDQELLNELLNSENFQLMYTKDNWDMTGAYKMFVIYKKFENPATPKENGN